MHNLQLNIHVLTQEEILVTIVSCVPIKHVLLSFSCLLKKYILHV